MTPQSSPDLQRWRQQYLISATALETIVERAHEGPTVPPFTGLPAATHRELQALSLQALTELRELTQEYLTETYPPTASPTSSVAPDREDAAAPIDGVPGRQPRSAWPAMDALPQALWIEDVSAGEHPIVYINQAFTDLTGYTREQVLGSPLSALQTRPTDPEPDADPPAGIRSGSTQIVLRHAEGHLLHVEVTRAPVIEGDADVVHHVAVLRSLR